MKNKTISYKKMHQKLMEDKKFKNEYKKTKKEFALAEEIIKLRMDAGLTQQELARKAKTSQPAIARLESGNYKNISFSFLNRIAKALSSEPQIHFKKLSHTH